MNVSTAPPRAWRWSNFDLLYSLVERQLLLRRKRSKIGAIWPMIGPILLTALYTFVFNGVFSVPVQDYPIYLFAGLLPWTLLLLSLSGGLSAISSEAALIRRAPFPSQMLPVAYVMVNVLSFLVLLVAFVVVDGISWHINPLLLPALLLPLASLILLCCAADDGARRVRRVQPFAPLPARQPPHRMVLHRSDRVPARSGREHLERAALGRPDEHDHRPVPRHPLLRTSLATRPHHSHGRRVRDVLRRGQRGVHPSLAAIPEGVVMHDAAIIVDDVWVGYRRTDVGIFKGRRAEPWWGLREIDFSVERGEWFGVIGPNGAGKTTLLQTLAGVLQPTRGKVLTAGVVSSLIELTAGFHRELTGRQNLVLQGVLLGMRRRDVRARLDEIMAFSGLTDEVLDEPLRMYSAGMGLRLGFALAVHTDPAVLLIDEVLAVGDEAFRARCAAKVEELRDEGCAVVMVSHDLELVTKHCDRVGLLDSGQMKLIDEPQVTIVEYLRLGLHVADEPPVLPQNRQLFRGA